ncbi:hypothetical protein VNO78_02886 [Psophocarpus tetragonolobus]|uniref:Uncharacterized protein n=1 Tax=Psophocarpus tetragonolobus TaxID=3891 RepID=A0AAN9XVL6_PSOTE
MQKYVEKHLLVKAGAVVAEDNEGGGAVVCDDARRCLTVAEGGVVRWWLRVCDTVTESNEYTELLGIKLDSKN